MPRRVIKDIEELKTLVGQEIGVSDLIEITQSQINAFADATGDHQWIHVDTERAKTDSPMSTTIAHGFLTLSLFPYFAAQAFEVCGNFKMGINYGLNKLRFTSPVPAGSLQRARFTLQSLEEIAGGIQIVLAVKVETEHAQKPSLIAEWLVRYYY